ncbi:hypothetical protein [Streptomyces sp. NPDC054849]
MHIVPAARPSGRFIVGQCMTTTAEQIAGETAALDLMCGYLTPDPE